MVLLAGVTLTRGLEAARVPVPARLPAGEPAYQAPNWVAGPAKVQEAFTADGGEAILQRPPSTGKASAQC
jgi:hypothetical protein